MLQLADRISVLRDGKFILELEPRTTSKDEIVRHMAGREAIDLRVHPREAKRRDAGVVLKVSDLSRKGEFEGVQFDLHRGEVLAISGLIGSGERNSGNASSA